LIRSEQLEPHELELLKLFAPGPITKIETLVKLARSTDLPPEAELLNNLVGEMEARGFLDRDPQGGDGVGLSELGKQILYSQGVVASSGAD
jgi:DNA-binding IclR family transcriptional regulator